MEIIDTDSSKTIETTIFEGTLGDMEDKIVEENTGITGVMIIIEVGIDQEIGHSQGIMVLTGIEVQVLVDQDQDLERKLEQLQQMLNLESEAQTHLLTDKQNSPIENCRTSSLNL